MTRKFKKDVARGRQARFASQVGPRPLFTTREAAFLVHRDGVVKVIGFETGDLRATPTVPLMPDVVWIHDGQEVARLQGEDLSPQPNSPIPVGDLERLGPDG